MRLLNRALQRYLIRLPSSTPGLGVPGPDPQEDADWLLHQVGSDVAIVPSSDPGRALVPAEAGVGCRIVSGPPDRERWQLRPADGDFKYLVDVESGLALAAETSDPAGKLVLRQAQGRPAMWLIQDRCVDDARSVHLRYQTSGDLSMFYNEVAIERATAGTFFCVAGFGANARADAPSGYAGVQQRPDGSRLAIFSVWHRMIDEVKVSRNGRAVIVGAAPHAETTEFSGEGSGSSIRIPYEWTNDAPVRFVLTAEPLGSDTAIAAYVAQGSAPWVHLGVVVRAETGGTLLNHPYAFIEDFLRNGNTPGVAATDRSPFRIRAGVFRNPWFAARQQPVEPVRRAHLTVYSPHPLETVSAELSSLENFGLRVATGTKSALEPPPIGKRFDDPASARRTPPDLTSVPHD